MNGRSKKLRTDEKRREILASASAALRKLGVHAVGMRQIAEAAGISAGNLYYYFRNKDELIYYCQDRTLDELLEVAERARLEADAREQLGALIRGHLRITLGHAAGPLHLEFGDLPPPLLKKVVKKRDRYEQKVRDLIADAQRRRELRPGSPKQDAFLLLGALNWASRWYQPNRGWGVDALADHHCDRILDGLMYRRS